MSVRETAENGGLGLETELEFNARSFTVTQYNTAIQRTLQSKVPPTWVHGVITQLNIRDRIAYITLGHFEENNPKPLATLQVFIWTNEFHAFNLKFAQLPTPFELKAELKVSMLLEAGFYVPFGKFQPKVLNIDENFTLGELAQTRKKIIDNLMRDGLLDRNKQRPLSPVPLVVGLITAPGSAAYQDFTTVLLESGYSWQILFYPAKMQGEETEKTVIKGIRFLQELPLDVLCIVRGGGAKTDLVYFDSEAICRAVALCPKPVLTGIGHEIDQSIADMVSHKNCITPTDCAVFLESRVGEAWDGLTAVAQSLLIAWEEGFEQQGRRLTESASLLKTGWERRQAAETERLKHKSFRLAGASRISLRSNREEHARMATGLRRGPQKLLAGPRERTVFFKRELISSWRQGLRREREKIKSAETLIQAVHPERLLRKGYSLIRDAGGRVVKSVSELRVSDKVEIQMSDGTAKTQVLSKEKKT